MTDPIMRLADAQLSLLSADLQVQLERGTGTRPVLFMLAKARERAAKAVLLFMDADTTDAALMLRLQQEINVYNDMVTSARELMISGKEARNRVKEQDRIELEEVIANMTDDERRLHGFERQGID